MRFLFGSLVTIRELSVLFQPHPEDFVSVLQSATLDLGYLNRTFLVRVWIPEIHGA